MIPHHKSRKRVVITGYGMITCLGANAQETFINCKAGRSGIDYIKSFDTSSLPCNIGGEVKEDWLDKSIVGKSLKYLSRGALLLIHATKEAYTMADLDSLQDRYRIGVSVGNHGDNPKIKDMLHLHRFYNSKGKWNLAQMQKSGGYNYLNFFKRKPDITSTICANVFDARGHNIISVSACAAGAQAIGEAYKAILDDRADVFVAGGSESVTDFFGYLGFISLKALAERYTSPQTASRPFDRKRNGFVMSEGAGVVILEEYHHALNRGAKIYGELMGYGASADAYRITDMHPKGLGAIIAMKKAIQDAGLTIYDIDYINAHGTSTLQNDMTETLAIKEVFGESARQIPISSNKSMLGHTIAAAGAIECVLTLMGINDSVMLPTINYEFPDPKCDLFYVPNNAIKKSHKIALSNSFGFGGQNACLCIGALRDNET